MSDGAESSSDVWLVVLFVDENLVEIIPKKWYIASIGKCYWPNNGSKVIESIKKCITPCSTWATYATEVLGEYGDYNEASRKVIKAKTSDVFYHQTITLA